MSEPTDPGLRPAAGERGLASWDPADLEGLLLPAWEAFHEVAAHTALDLFAESRVTGRSAREVCVSVGSWGGSRSVAALVEEARSHPTLEPAGSGTFDQEAHDAALLETWAAAPRDELLTAVDRARDETATYLASPEAADLGRTPVRTSIGPLPLTTVVCGRTYELAVAALDLAPAGAPEPPRPLLSAGLAALTDTTGALAARLDLRGQASVVSPDGSWTFSAEGRDWRTLDLPRVPGAWPRIEGSASDLLDAASGRRKAAPMLARRTLRVHHPAALVPFAALLDVPGLPGAPALGSLVRSVQGVRHLLGRLPGGR